VALLLVLFVAVPVVGHAGGEDAPVANAANLPKIHIDNFGRVSANYFRGAEPDDAEYGNLASLGIKTVIDLRSDDVDQEDELLVERAGMKYVQIPMTTRVAPTQANIDQFLQIVESAENLPVYVHCVGGKHRTGVMTAIYRMTHEGWTADRAFKEMKQYKFGPDFLHPEFKKFVYGFQPKAILAAKVAE
jgi:uncharacterized protein (TIGR01244 family)